MSSITISDFIPPIVPRVYSKVLRLISSNIKIHPFDQVPSNIQAKLILDVGANVGNVALAALKTYPGSRVR